MIIHVLFVIFILGSCFTLFFWTYRIWQLNVQRRRGNPKSAEKITMFDVRRLLMNGEKKLAVKLYRQIFPVDQKTAEKDVAELDKSLKKSL